MTYRGSWTLAITMILNPVILLFYQNCSYIPSSQLARGPASVILQQVAYAEQSPGILNCQPKHSTCAENN